MEYRHNGIYFSPKYNEVLLFKNGYFMIKKDKGFIKSRGLFGHWTFYKDDMVFVGVL